MNYNKSLLIAGISILSLGLRAQNTFPTSGNVGIGTTTPITPLQITNSGGYGALMLGTNVANQGHIFTHEPDHSFNIWSSPFGPGSIKRFTILPSGNVGIGLNTPDELLHVNGSIKIPIASNVKNDSPGLIFFSNDDMTKPHLNGQYVNHYGIGAYLYTDPNINLQGYNTYISGFYGVDLYTGGENRLRVSAMGNIGIGTLMPIGKLDVMGQQYLRDADYPMLMFRPENPASTKFGNIHYDGSSATPTNEMRFGRYDKATGQWEKNPFRFDLDAPDGTFYVNDIGRVGIGTYDVNGKLDVFGGAFYIRDTSYPTLMLKAENSSVTSMAGILYDGNGKTPGNSITFAKYDKTATWKTNPYTFNIDAPNFTIYANKDGNVGIGTPFPQVKLEVNSTGAAYGKIANFVNGASETWIASNTGNGAWNSLTKLADNGIFWRDDSNMESANGFVIAPWSDFSKGIRIDGPTGNVGIGEAYPTAKLQVKSDVTNAFDIADNSGAINFRVKTSGVVYAREVNVQLNPFPDYVFEKNYKLTSLDSLETYIKENKHLPNIPSAKQVSEKGVNVGEMQRLQMEKIEELTLYIIELKKQEDQKNKEMLEMIKELKKENETLKNKK